MKKKKAAARYILFALTLFLLVPHLPTIGRGDSTAPIEESSSVRVWLNRDCGTHYKEGESFPIFFTITSPASKAIVTILMHTPEGQTHYIIRRTLYATNETFSVTETAECPPDLKTLEILVTIYPSFLPPEMIPRNPVDIHVSDTCHFYVDPPCADLDNDKDGYYPSEDCNDSNPLIHPGAQEVCDGKDNDCDGQIDEECYTCIIDWDEDSYSECNDCNDHDNTVYPDASEICDGKDNDCDGETDEGCCVCFNDHDRDGYSDCNDCNDHDPTVYPDASEICDSKDNDCDGDIDEGTGCEHVRVWVDEGCGGTYSDGDTVEVSYAVYTPVPTAVVTLTLYHSEGVPTQLVSEKRVKTNTVYNLTMSAACPQGLQFLVMTATLTVDGKQVSLTGDCGFLVVSCRTADRDGDGYDSVSSGGDDCDDSDPRIHPGAEEVCDGKDNDCDGFTDEGFDCDYAEIWVGKECGETYDDRERVDISFRVHSSAASALVTITDYPPQSAPVILVADRKIWTNAVYHLSKVARCSGSETLVMTAVVVSEGETLTLVDDCSFYAINCKKDDNDGDGHNSVLVGGDDCDDDDPDVYPGALDICDGKDNDCDGQIDEVPDEDEDGYMAAKCGGDDCNDKNPAIHPGAEEVFDGVDNDCDGERDEGITADQIDQDRDGYSLAVDCNDSDPHINPGVSELCDDGKDNDCDGKIDCEDGDCTYKGACVREVLGRVTEKVTPFFTLSNTYFLIGLAATIAVVGGLITYKLLKKREKPPEADLATEDLK